MARYRTIPNSRTVAFQLPLTDIARVEALAREREASSTAEVLRDAVHVGLTVRLTLAKAIHALASIDVDDGECLHAGPEAPEVVARQQLVRELSKLYGNIVVGQVFDLEPGKSDEPDADKRRRAAERRELIEDLVRNDLGLPEKNLQRALQTLMDEFAALDFAD